MKRYDRITPPGTKDYVFDECECLRSVCEKLRGLFTEHDYLEVRTPTIEFFDTFSNGVGKISQDELYTLTDSSGRLLVLRPDSTKPIARLCASRLNKRSLPLRIWYNQPVFRRNIQLCKKSDENLQSGVELIGSKSIKADIEMLLLAVESMNTLFGRNFLIEIGHMGLIRSLLSNISDPILSMKTRIAIASKNYPELLSLSDCVGEAGRALREIPKSFGSPDILDLAKNLFSKCEEQKALDELKLLCQIVKDHGYGENIIVDLAVVNDYEYYTGVVFRGYIRDEGMALLSGGRYDTLYSDYGIDMPAVGFAVGVNDVARIMSAKAEKPNCTDKILMIYSSANKMPQALSEAKKYKLKGYKTQISLDDNDCDAIANAKKSGAELIIIKD
ncbi:MAG: ATP phosphoribosyltransferase regulatory subunit [Christensenellaceae bacterium]|nr:ATP phosphoribosyltransferase regulatory subunit [Christensenellaceae bacterium]